MVLGPLYPENRPAIVTPIARVERHGVFRIPEYNAQCWEREREVGIKKGERVGQR